MMTELKHQFNDPSAKILVQLTRLNPWAEEHVKTATLDPTHASGLSDSAFAWEERRMFPIDTPANALASYLYIEKQADAVPEYVKEAAINMLDLYGVSREEVVTAETEKTAAVTYAFPEQKRWAITCPEDVSLADTALREMDREVSFIEKTAAAVRVVRAAETHGVEPSTDLLQKAGMVAGDINQTIDWLEARAGVSDGDISEKFCKLASELVDVDPLCYDRTVLVKLANLISEMDKEAKIEYLYDRQIPTPTETVFNTDKLAEDTVDVAGKVVPVSALAKVPPQVWEQLLGEDAKELLPEGQADVEKLREIVPTLPKDILVVLSRYV